jgi:hypothetical protein
LKTYWIFDVDRLAKKACLRPGWFGTCQWTDRNDDASMEALPTVK